MRYVILIAFLAFLAFPAAASDDRGVFYGTWGNEQQCARAPIKPGGTVLAEPFEIDGEWLRQGRLWCRLKWFPIETREDGVVSGAHAQCGEDSVRDYVLGFDLTDGELRLRWDFLLSNGPFPRCPPS